MSDPMTPAQQYLAWIKRLGGEATQGDWEWCAEDASMISLNTVNDQLEGHVLTSSLCGACHDRHAKVDGKVAPFKNAHCLMPRRPDRDLIVALHNSRAAVGRVIRAAEAYTKNVHDGVDADAEWIELVASLASLPTQAQPEGEGPS